jgi:hypothetical protein
MTKPRSIGQRVYEVPEGWAYISRVGPFRIEPCVKASCKRKRPTIGDMFYRLFDDRTGEWISDHGSRDGAEEAAKRYRSGERWESRER